MKKRLKSFIQSLMFKLQNSFQYIVFMRRLFRIFFKKDKLIYFKDLLRK